MSSLVGKVNDIYYRLDEKHCQRVLFELEIDSLETLWRTEAMRIVLMVLGFIFNDSSVCDTVMKRLVFIIVYNVMYVFNRLLLKEE